MKSTTNNSDVQSLIGESVSPEYLYQDQEAELLAADAEDFEGYSEWSSDIEEAAWDGAKEFNGVMVKKACEHSTCSHFRCERSTRLGGIEI
jgi:hypothetical protein